MEMIGVASSHLEKIGYNPFNQVLRIQFRDGSIYEYAKVPESIFQGLLNASSKGRYHASMIKEKYAYTRTW